MKFTKLMVFVLVLAAFASLAAGQEWQEKRFVVALDKDGVQRVEVTGGAYYFDPNTIVVKVNVPVELVVKRTPGGHGHDIILKAPEAGIDVSQELSTDPKPIRFTPTKVGKYEFYCDHKVPFSKSHKDRGMYGYLEVVE